MGLDEQVARGKSDAANTITMNKHLNLPFSKVGLYEQVARGKSHAANTITVVGTKKATIGMARITRYD